MDQTPAHEAHNPELLRMIPRGSRRLLEVGCSAGALAREFKKLSPDSDYVGLEIDTAYADLARRYCDTCLVLDIETADAAFWAGQADRDCWIFGDVLEHLVDPWAVLRKIRAILPPGGSVVACLPNAQHWSLQVRLNSGEFRYETQGLLDKTHLRWFTRKTMIEMFDQAGFEIREGIPRTFDEPQRATFLPAIEHMARLAGVDPALAVSDSLAIQYVVRAVAK